MEYNELHRLKKKKKMLIKPTKDTNCHRQTTSSGGNPEILNTREPGLWFLSSSLCLLPVCHVSMERRNKCAAW